MAEETHEAETPHKTEVVHVVETTHVAETAHKTLHHGHEPPSRMTAEEALVEDGGVADEFLQKRDKMPK